MKIPPQHPREQERLKALLQYKVMDTEFERSYDELTELASNLCKAPICLISLVDSTRQWFKSTVGIDARETSRDIAFCSHAILENEVLVVNDATKDERFYDNPLVVEEPKIRFYAGAPLINQDGYPLGTLCVIDRHARDFSDEQKRALQIVAQQVMYQLELRLANQKLVESVEELQKMNEAKGKFFSIISHDMRSPFNSIISLTALIKSDPMSFSPEEMQESLEIINRSSQTALGLFDNLLLWSQAESGFIKVAPSLIKVGSIFENVRGIVDGQMTNKKISLELVDPEHLQIYCDENMFGSILQNLIGNAIKFSHVGGNISIRVISEEPMTLICVEDQGVGMEKEKCEKLFNVGEKVSSLGTKGESGTGLGLLLCHQFVAANHGEIHVESELGKGTTFYLKFPSHMKT